MSSLDIWRKRRLKSGLSSLLLLLEMMCRVRSAVGRSLLLLRPASRGNKRNKLDSHQDFACHSACYLLPLYEHPHPFRIFFFPPRNQVIYSSGSPSRERYLSATLSPSQAVREGSRVRDILVNTPHLLFASALDVHSLGPLEFLLGNERWTLRQTSDDRTNSMEGAKKNGGYIE